MREWYKSIYLSPHLDDAALSCGGQIFMETSGRNPVLIVTIMTKEPSADLELSDFAKSLHHRWELARDAAVVRRAEDVVACQILGADHLHWPVLDCIYRTDPDTGAFCYPDWQSIITTWHPADEAVLDWLVGQLHQLPAAEQIYAPFAVGNHVDHRLVRRAAEQTFGEKLLYYEDFPYAVDPENVEAVLASSSDAWQSTNIALSETAVRTKTDAIWAYASQRTTFFKSRADLEEQMHTYTAKVGGERLWWPTNNA